MTRFLIPLLLFNLFTHLYTMEKEDFPLIGPFQPELTFEDLLEEFELEKEEPKPVTTLSEPAQAANLELSEIAALLQMNHADNGQPGMDTQAENLSEVAAVSNSMDTDKNPEGLSRKRKSIEPDKNMSSNLIATTKELENVEFSKRSCAPVICFAYKKDAPKRGPHSSITKNQILYGEKKLDFKVGPKSRMQNPALPTLLPSPSPGALPQTYASKAVSLPELPDMRSIMSPLPQIPPTFSEGDARIPNVEVIGLKKEQPKYSFDKWHGAKQEIQKPQEKGKKKMRQKYSFDKWHGAKKNCTKKPSSQAQDKGAL